MRPSKSHTKCVVSTCSSVSDYGIPLFRFPTDIWRRSEWSKALNLSMYLLTSQSSVCVLHFLPNQLIKTGNHITLQNDAVPSIEAYWERNLPDEPSTSNNQSSDCTGIFQSGSCTDSDNREMQVKEEPLDDPAVSYSKAFESDFQTTSPSLAESAIAGFHTEIKDEPEETAPSWEKIGNGKVNAALRVGTAKRNAISFGQSGNAISQPNMDELGIQAHRNPVQSATATITPGRQLIFFPSGSHVSGSPSTAGGDIGLQQSIDSLVQVTEKRTVVNPAIRVTPRQLGIPPGIGIRAVVRPIHCVVKTSGGITTTTKEPTNSTPRIISNESLRITRRTVQKPSPAVPYSTPGMPVVTALPTPTSSTISYSSASTSRTDFSLSRSPAAISKTRPLLRASDKSSTTNSDSALQHLRRPDPVLQRRDFGLIRGYRGSTTKPTMDATGSDNDKNGSVETSDVTAAISNSLSLILTRCEVISASRMKFEPAKVFLLYTGIEFGIFDALSKDVKNSWESLKAITKEIEASPGSDNQKTNRQSLSSCEDELLMLLIKLKTSFSAPVVAYLFGQETDVVIDVLQSWIPFLANWLLPFIMWPSNKTDFAVKKALKKGQISGSLAVLDVVDIQFVMDDSMNERTSAKFVVVYTWSGAILYRSRLFDGKKTSDQNAILACSDDLGFSDNARMTKAKFPDYYVVDRKSCVVKDRCVELHKAKKTYGPITMKLKQFGILVDGAFPIALLPCLDEIVTICCALVNLQPRHLDEL